MTDSPRDHHMMSDAGAVAFIQSHTAIAAPPLLPEIRLHLATEITPLWLATEAALARQQLPPPYWAFAWVGGQAVARYVLDHPEWVVGQRVFDFAAGSGLVAIAAARVGAARVVAAEIDPLAMMAVAMNAALNGVVLETLCIDIIDDLLVDIDVILAGDVCYEKPMSERVIRWFRALAAAGKTVLLGDPGRNYRPTDGLCSLAQYVVPTTRELEDRDQRETTVWQLLP